MLLHGATLFFSGSYEFIVKQIKKYLRSKGPTKHFFYFVLENKKVVNSMFTLCGFMEPASGPLLIFF